jgi:hypothetical protein
MLVDEPELDGLVVWFDRNSNGFSDPGEVVSLSCLGIVSLAVRAQRGDDGILNCPVGLIRWDGSYAPTYDWIAEQRDRPGTQGSVGNQHPAP